MPGLVKAGAAGYFDFNGLVVPDNANLKILVGKTSAAGAYSCVRELGSATDYVVPAAKFFKCLGVIVYESLNAIMDVSVGYGDTASTFGGGAAPTTPKCVVGGGAVSAISNVAASGRLAIPLKGFNIPTGKYPYVQEGGGAAAGCFLLVGYEEA